MQQTSLPPIKGFIENSFTEWPGHSCAVLLLPYCNLRCPYCHQHRLVLKPDTIESLALDDIFNRIARADGPGHSIDRICISGGEPTIHRTLPGLLRKIRERGFKTAIATNGTQPEILQDLIGKGLLDHIFMDVKAPLDDASYSRCCGVPVPAGLIKASIYVLLSSSVSLTFRCTVIPSLLSETDIHRLARNLKDLWNQCPLADRPAARLVLHDIIPDDTMDEALRSAQPLGEKALADLQRQVDDMIGSEGEKIEKENRGDGRVGSAHR